MTPAILVMISMMWIPLGMLFLGQGDAKSSGFVTGLAGILTLIGAFYQAAQADLLTASALFVFGMLYLQVSHALLAGVSDMRTVGWGAAVVGLVCLLIALIIGSGYLFFMFITFVILCLAVFLNCYGKMSGKIVGWLLIILALICLIYPGYALMGHFGGLPF
jgi:putative amide transporter protein